MRRSNLIALAGLGLAACVVGQHLDTFAPANGPAGGIITVSTFASPTDVTGELLAVEDSTLLLVRNDTLIRVSTRKLRAIDAPSGGGNGALDRHQREQLRLISRYPGGVSPDLERRLIEAYHQPGVKAVP